MRRTIPLSLFAALAAAVFATPALAQTVQGRLVDDATGAPVAEAQIAAVDAGGRTVRSVLTDAQGGFTLALPQAGRYAIQASRLGYQSVTTLEVAVAAGDPLEVEVHIAASAVALQPLTAITRARDAGLVRRGFYTRREAYERLGAQFLDRESLDRINPARVSDVFRHVPGVRVRTGPNRTATLMMRSCEASLFVDGRQVNRLEQSQDVQKNPRTIRDWLGSRRTDEAYDIARQGTRVDAQDRLSVDDVVSGSSIAAVEVYPTSQIPPEFTGFQARPCGVIAIWTGVSRG
ncbi:MAG TPA: carboxypeptidase-like regulatory domain-containing protein [Longimicrobium sp.]|nr:carboxypeptidase-like regulatory domain-containing protein [Longimicrobium sp.]